MELFQGMEYVYEVYKERSFSKAAANLFISQPSLSANVRRVENQIGYPIFDRSTKPLGITEYGLAYIRCAEKIMSVRNDFETYLNDLGNLRTGSLTIGGSNLYSSWMLPPLIAAFTEKYPMVKITLVEEGTKKLKDMLMTGQLDIMMDNLDLPEEEFEHRKYLEEELVLAVPADFPANQGLEAYQIPENAFDHLSDHPCVPLDRFTDCPFILLRQENDTGKRARIICHDAGFHPEVLFEMDQQMTAYNITCSGLAISFVGSLLIARTPMDHSVLFYRLPGSDRSREISFYWKRGRYLSKAMEEFLKLSCKLDTI